MKTLKFRPELITEILSGARDTTWRLFDEKSLAAGDKVELLNWETKEKFADAELVSVTEKRMGDITLSDFEKMHDYGSVENMFAHFRQYYGDKVNDDAVMKIIRFRLI